MFTKRFLQAWSAVIANLEDAMNAFKTKVSNFTTSYESFLNRQDQFRTILDALPEDSEMLARVPLLDKLTQAMVENQSPNSVLQGEQRMTVVGRSMVSSANFIVISCMSAIHRACFSRRR